VNINVIIFDCDGVIIDSGTDIVEAVLYTMRHFNVPGIPKEEIISYVGRGAEVLIKKCFKDCDEELLKQVVPFYKDHYFNNCTIKTTLYKNIKETLEYFKDRKIAMVTNKPERITERILKILGVSDYFKLIIGPESVKRAKPDPEGLLKVLEVFGEKPERALMVGDSEYDIQAGKSAGVHTCGVTYGLGSLNDLIATTPDFLIDEMIKLTGII